MDGDEDFICMVEEDIELCIVIVCKYGLSLNIIDLYW